VVRSLVSEMTDVDRIYDWLVDGAPGVTGPAAIVQRLCDDLATAGVPIDRAAAFVQTLHPQVMGRSFEWARGGVVEVRDAAYQILTTPVFTNSPVAVVCATGRRVRCRLRGTSAPREFDVLDQLADMGFSDYVAVPLTFLSGQIHTMTFATNAPDGFSDAHVAVLERMMRRRGLPRYWRSRGPPRTS
jgi:adenylate cyclase